jgi:hypothetical protein
MLGSRGFQSRWWALLIENILGVWVLDASHVIAVHFRTIAQANDYWRD